MYNLREKVTPKSSLFWASLIGSKRSAFSLTEVSASEVPAILKKFVSKEGILRAAILKLSRPCLCDIIPTDSKLAGRRKTCR